MRLIDADKLIEICRKGWKLFGREDEKLKHWVDENDIREQPTVDAIPISIIKEELDNARKMYDNSTELTEPYWRGSVSALEVLIIRWEKENEIN